MSIKAKALLVTLPVAEGETARYRLVPQDVVKIDETEFLTRLANKASQNTVQARFWMDSFRDVFYSYLAENAAIDLSFLYAKLYVGGSLSSANEQPTKEKNPVLPRIFAKGELADAIAAIEVVNDTVTVEALINEFMQDNASAKNRIEAANTRIVITGKGLYQDPDQADEKAWLENIDTGVVVAEGTVSYSDASTAFITFATLPADKGKYRFCYTTRNGGDPDEVACAKVTRQVIVDVAE